MNVNIYFPQESARVFQYHLNKLGNRLFNEWTFYNDIDAFKNSNRDTRRVACFQIPYPWNPKFEKQIDDIYDHTDHILILGSELHAPIVNFIERYDKEKIAYFLCGNVRGPIRSAKTYKFLDWFTTTVHFYKHVNPSILYNLRPFETKPLMFDALLGRKKPHRDLAHRFIQDNNLIDQSITTYINAHEFKHDDNPSTWQWESNGVENFEESSKKIEFTVDRVMYHGYNMSVSQIMPFDIYNQTAYSLVAETNCENSHVFFTEKTIKPILARRLFIILSNRFSLAALRRLGFKTFNGIIDESYDEILDPIERHIAALEQLEWLCNQNQADILAQARPIIEHNFNLMYGTDWYNLFHIDFGNYFFETPYRAL